MNKENVITAMIDTNIALATDAYKQTHWMQYPEDTQVVYSYLESRGCESGHADDDKTLFYGLQIYLKKYLTGEIVTQSMVDEADEFCFKVFGKRYFNRNGWERIVNVHKGRLPVRIKAVPEGSVVPTHNVLMTVENTDPELPFVTNFVETMLMQIGWYPTTVATKSYRIKNLIAKYAEKTGCQVNPFHLNDFGFRGASSMETAGIGGSAHLVNFLGTDTLEGIRYAMRYYGADVCGYSVMAAEHSTITIYGRENEAEAIERILDKTPKDATVSIVSDSFDIYNVCQNVFGQKLKSKILARSGKLVVRPDSGYPPTMCVEVLDMLWKAFGGTENGSGYKVLNPCVGIIYGDGIDYCMIEKILIAVADAGYSIENVVFGMGGALLQQVNRDTYKFAFKCCAAIRGGNWVTVYKDPVTDKGKVSKRGRVALIDDPERGYRTLTEDAPEYWDAIESNADKLVTVYENGNLLREYTFDEIRQRAESERAKYGGIEYAERRLEKAMA